MAEDDLLRFRLWMNQDIGLFPQTPAEPEDPDTPPVPQWCERSADLLEWAEVLLEKLARHPHPHRFTQAKAELSDRYYWSYMGARPEHQPEFNLDGHPCIHRAYISILERLDRMRLALGISEFEPVPVRIIEQSEALPPRRQGREVNGSLIGTVEDDWS